jgi:hypothetical protein
MPDDVGEDDATFQVLYDVFHQVSADVAVED